MSIQASVFIAQSLDGFIARKDGSIDWLNAQNAAVPPGEDCGYRAFIETIDVLIMGRNTFDHVLAFDPWPYDDLEIVVLSHRPLSLPEGFRGKVGATAEPPRALLERLAQRGARRVYVDGGATIQAFLAEGLIDDLTLTTVPVLLGEGRPLFGPLARDVRLSLVASKAFPFGFVQSTYRLLTGP
jgi:dihydrofolate reductase